MTLDDIKALIESMKADPSTATDEKLAEAGEALRAIVAEQREAGATPETVKVLTEVKAAKDAISAEQTARADATAKVNEQAERLLADLADPDPADETPAAADTAAPADSGDTGPADEQQVDVEQREPALAASGGRNSDLETTMAGLLKAVQTVMTSGQPQSVQASAERPTGRTARPAAAATSAPAPQREAVTMRVRAAGGSGGAFQHGQDLGSTAELGRAFADRLRGMGKGRGGDGERQYVARTELAYPDSRVLTASDFDGNHAKIEAVTAARSLVAAGGLCAPLETLYDVEVVGSTARPVRDALARFAVDRGGIQYRPNSSAAAAVNGAGVWTLEDDAATPLGEKGCYVVECPAVEEAVIEAVYLCMEFGNITARFDPETTAANVQEGMIAHARVAENQLLDKIGAGSKLLTSAQAVGASRDILANLDKATAYYRNRHRIDTSLSLTYILPAWVRSLFRADLARQMAAGDWMEALAPADSMIDGWFTRRGISPVWHLDGPTGTNEVQTVTITGAPTGGTFTLTFDGQTTEAIAYNASAATVRAALEALSNVNVGDVTTAGGPLPGTAVTVTFAGQYEGANVAQMTATGSFTGGTTPAVAVTTASEGGGAITVGGTSIVSQTYPDAAAGGVIPAFPTQIDGLLFTTGSWLFLDGGSLDLGLVRDSELNSRNRYRQFTETFEGVADRGIESLRLVMGVKPDGSAAGTVDPATIAA